MNIPDGAWLVVVEDGDTEAIEIELPKIGGDEVAARIRGLNHEELWSRALAASGIGDSPSEIMLDMIASEFEV